MPSRARATLNAFLVASLVVLGQIHPVAAATAETDAAIARVLELTNAERQKAGVPPLALSGELTSAAQSYSVVLATSGCFAHNCGPVPDMANRLGQAGYQGWTAIAENIAAGYPTPEDVVAGWMSSPGHRANMLSPNYAEIGIGLATGGGRYGTFWTQDFGTRRFIPPPPAPAPVEAAVEPMPEPEPEPEAVPMEEEAPPDPLSF